MDNKIENLLKEFKSKKQIINEVDIYQFFSNNYTFFSPYENYFYLRYNEYKLIKSLFPNIFSQKKILEIGCGFGFNSFLLSLDASKVHGIDIPEKYPSLVVGEDATSVEVANNINSILDFNNLRFSEYWPTNMTGIDNNSFDLCFSEYVFEHIPDLDLSLKEMYRVLRKGGEMVHVVPITQDAVISFLYSNIDNSKKKKTILNLLRNIKNPVIIPGCHSEFLNDFKEQIELYSLENYVFKMQECGFVIKDIKQTREHNRIIYAIKQ